jgi:enoyl-CoA hydratase/carnithine racemase
VRERRASKGRSEELSPQEEVLFSLREGIAVITLNRPRQLNAMNHAMFVSLARAFIRVAADESVKVAILTGNGRAFSAGLDLNERYESGARRPGQNGLTSGVVSG